MSAVQVFYNTLLPELLSALNWKGVERQIPEAMPYGRDALDLQDFRDTLAHLGYSSVIRRALANQINATHLPAIQIQNYKEPKLLKNQADLDALEDKKSLFLIFSPIPQGQENLSLRQDLRRLKPLLREILFLSLVVGAVALAPISFNRAIYDHIIASGSTKGMAILFAGTLMALAAEMVLRLVRNRRLALLGGRLDHYVSCSVFERLLYLPPLYTERASVSAQLARLRDFENVREFFTGPLATLFFEMPLVGVYLIVMACMAHWLVLVPVGLLICYALLIAVMNGKLKENSRASSTIASQRQEFLLETVTKLRAIRLAGMEQAWQERYHAMSGRASLAAFRAGFTAQIFETASYVLMTLGGVATLGFGVLLVINQDLTTGALIASMMLIWRIVAPMQIACASITRIQQLFSSTKQVERLLAVAPERNPYAPTAARPQVKGRISFHRVSLRYTPESEPAILGVSFDIQPGQIVAIKGSNGSGKSTILKLILGLYQPQGGSIRIDGVDIRQFDPVALRQSLAYIPQTVDFLPGTVDENLMFANPVADIATRQAALDDARAEDELVRLPLGGDTVVEGSDANTISFMLRQRLNLARAYIKPTAIMLFDEASHSLGLDNDEAFAQKIAALRGKSTVLLVTHREDHMRLADILLVMDKGELTHAGAPDQVLTVLKGRKA